MGLSCFPTPPHNTVLCHSLCSNVVGYQKIALSEGFNLVGLQFTKIGGTAKDLSTFSVLDETFDGYDDDYKFTSRLRTWDKTNQARIMKYFSSLICSNDAEDKYDESV